MRDLGRTLFGLGAAARRRLQDAIPPNVLAMLVSTRVALTIVGVMSVALIPSGQPTEAFPPTGITALDVWTRWDGPFYVQIATSGYDARPPLPTIVFFPLYPALIRVVATIGGGGSVAYWLAPVVISLASLTVAVGYLIALARIDFGDHVARRAALYLLVFPTSLFLSAVYPESLFLALTVASFYYARRGTWWLVGLLGLAAALTRPYGALLAIPLAFEYLLQRDFDWRRIRPGLLWLGLIPMGLVLFLGYIAWKFGPGAMGAAQDIWGRAAVPPWEVLARYVEGPIIVHGFSTLGSSLVDLGFAAFFAAMVVVAWLRLRPSYALYSTLLLAAFLSSGKFVSVPRYGLALFPVFLGLALLTDEGARHDAFITASLILAGLAMALFATVRWVA
jgi:Mannosyltransferase (PIG-V)